MGKVALHSEGGGAELVDAREESLHKGGVGVFDNDGSYEPTVFHKLRPGYARENCELFEAHVKKMIQGLVHSDVRQCYDDGNYQLKAQRACDAATRYG